jgi:hypothetical protein
MSCEFDFRCRTVDTESEQGGNIEKNPIEIHVIVIVEMIPGYDQQLGCEVLIAHGGIEGNNETIDVIEPEPDE